MRSLIIIIWCNLICLLSYGQNKLEGIVRNENDIKLYNVLINVNSTQTSYYTDKEGKFEVWINKSEDTLSFSLNGYQTLKLVLSSSVIHHIVLKKQLQNRKQLNSFILQQQDHTTIQNYGNETYYTLIENPVVNTSQSQSVSFTINTNRASYSNIRRFIGMEDRVPSDAVRIEEMLNYFNFNYTNPYKNEVFRASSVISSCPWNNKHKLMFVSVSAQKLNLETIPPSNLVFLIDVSGSMDLPNKLPLIKSGLRLLIKNLRAIDSVSLVVYGSMVSVPMEGVSGIQKDTLNNAVESLIAEGSTPGEAGLKLAYKVAKRRFIAGGNNRIILATDGDFNVGVSTEKELEELIEQQGETGIHLTCLGVGMGNYKDSKLSLLAFKGQGNFAYIDNEQEAEKILVTELTRTLFTVAENVYLTVRFDSSKVKEFRLIGYENEKSAAADSLSKLEGGEIGSGHSLMVLFEIATIPKIMNNKPIANLNIHYRLPNTTKEYENQYKCLYNFLPYRNLDSSLKKAINVTMLGMKLKGSSYAKRISWSFIENNAKKIFVIENPLDQQYLLLISKAKKIYKKRNKE